MYIGYTDIAINSFLANLVFALESEALIYAMHEFSPEHLLPAIIISWLAATLAYVMNYATGRFIDHVRVDTDNRNYDRAQRLFRRWLAWLLLLAGQPLVGIVALGAGIFAVPWRHVILLISVGHALRYTWLVLS